MKTRTYGCIAIITGTAVYEPSVPRRFTAIWARAQRADGPQFFSWRPTSIPPRA